MSGPEEIMTVSASGGLKAVKPEQFDQIPIEPLMELARHYGAGAAKYEAHQFRKGYEWSKSFNALMRHAFAWWGGEMTDPETKTDHMAAVAWHAFNLMQLAIDHPEFDDRYKGEEDEEEMRYEPKYPLPFPNYLFTPPSPTPWQATLSEKLDQVAADVEQHWFDKEAMRWRTRGYVSDQEWADAQEDPS